MELNKKWQVSGDTFFLRDRSVDAKELSKGVYTVEKHPVTGELYLKRIEEKFDFSFKIYGLETDFINRVMKSYTSTNSNMGVIANGIKGTGKTISMKIVANQTDLPIILVQNPYPALNTFISEIQQDLVIFVDEYEKVYSDGNRYDDDDDVPTGSSALLSLMDGTYTTKYRRMFLLTTNKLWINENMLNRPGRIRYLKTYSDLNKEQIMDIVDDCLNKELEHFKDRLVEYLSICEIITVDIVKSVISEVNIHEEDPFVCCKDFNIQFKTETYILQTVPKDEKEVPVPVIEDIHISVANNFIKMAEKNNTGARIEGNGHYIRFVSVKNDIYTVIDHHAVNPGKEFKVRLTKQKRFHSSFAF